MKKTAKRFFEYCKKLYGSIIVDGVEYAQTQDAYLDNYQYTGYAVDVDGNYYCLTWDIIGGNPWTEAEDLLNVDWDNPNIEYIYRYEDYHNYPYDEMTPAQISVDNGNTFVSAAAALEQVAWDVIVNYMDDDIRQAVHDELAPCSDLDFLNRYLQLSDDDLIIG
jgi:hypothetical protein